MPGAIAEQAVVIGAGIGGLSAAKAVAPFFERVLVLDRDTLPDAPAPRAGTPQARHAHALLAGGQKALEQLFPGFGDDLAKSGAVPIRAGRDVVWERPGYDPFPVRDLGFDVSSMSRPLLERLCRRRLGAARNVAIRPRSRVTGIVASPDRRGVAAVVIEHGSGLPERLPADLVIDASGRAGPTLAFFDAVGSPRPDETEIGIDIGYATGIFVIPDPAPEWKGLSHLPAPPKEFRGGLILPIEGRRWIVSIGGRHGDNPPDDLNGFLAFTETFRTPTFHDAIARAKLVGDIARYNLPASVRRHFERLERSPRGLIPLGDSVCRFNPVFGQGMSVAAQEAVVLSNLLEFPTGPRRSARRPRRAVFRRRPGKPRLALVDRGHRLRPPRDPGPAPAGSGQPAPLRRRPRPSRRTRRRGPQALGRSPGSHQARGRAARTGAREPGDGADGGGMRPDAD